MKKKILIIDDDADICKLLSRLLNKNGYETDYSLTGLSGLAKCRAEKFDIVICDYRLGDKEGRDVLVELKEIDPGLIVFIITGYSDIKIAVEVIKLGAHDYISKPLIPDEVLSVISNALDNPTTRVTISSNGERTRADKQTKNGTLSEDYLVGLSAKTKELYDQIDIVAPTSYSIILYGESGTGKEVVAKTIHDRSMRSSKPFIAMDCGTLSKELAGSELFGHIKGSFTGAVSDKEGHFELANGGTLFLDEVANLPLDVQASLLRVIQERKIKRVGGNKEIEVDVRIIVASNENLQQAYRTGKFREDLFHRFNEFSISLPPLRNRKEDIPLFADYFLKRTNIEIGKDIEGFDNEVMDIFLRYNWPGNLREFRNVIRRAVLLTKTGKINASILPAEIKNAMSFEDNIGSTEVPVVKPAVVHDIKNASAKAEYETIINLLKEVNYNKKRAAEILKIDRKTLYNKLKNYEENVKNQSLQ